MLRLCVALFSSVLALPSLAAPQVFVVGLFPGAAVLNVDGQRKLVRVGTDPQGVQVVSADSRKAVLRIDGVERTYELSREYNEAGYSAPQRQSFSIARGTGGHYCGRFGERAEHAVPGGYRRHQHRHERERGAPPGYRLPGGRQADGRLHRQRHLARLAGDPDRVKIGGIELLGVEAAVIEGGYPTEALLGMSFLNRVRWREEQDAAYRGQALNVARS